MLDVRDDESANRFECLVTEVQLILLATALAWEETRCSDALIRSSADAFNGGHQNVARGEESGRLT